MTYNRAYFRPARDKDQTAVLRFTRNTYEHGDYIRLVWKDWLSDCDGKLIVASIKRQAVAVAHVARLSPSETWLEGLRVDPDYRGVGLATKLTGYGLKNAEQMKAGVMRFITSSRNTPIHALSAQLGFNTTVVLQTYQVLPIGDSSLPLTKASMQDQLELTGFISKSKILKDMNGLFSSGWQFLKLDENSLEARIKSGQVAIISDDLGIQAAAVFEKRDYDQNLVICYADGQKTALLKLLNTLRQFAHQEKLVAVTARLPVNSGVIKIFEATGFQPTADEPFWIFEKQLTG